MFENIYAGKKVLVTGHTGFKGSWLTMWLLQLGAEVAGYSIGVPSTPSHFDELQLAGKIQHNIGDIRDYDRLFNVCNSFQPEIIFHLAAQPLVRYSYENPRETFEVNMSGTLNVLECIRNMAETVKVGIIITSDKCYDNVEWIFGYREIDPLGGEDPYSGSKGAAELVAKSYIKSYFNANKGVGPRVSTVRAGNVIGGGDWAKDRIIPDIVRSWSHGSQVQVRSPRSTRPWQHVLEPLSGYLDLAAQLWKDGRLAGEAFNFGPDSRVNKTVGELLNEIEKYWPNAAGWKDTSAGESGGKESNLLKLNCDKANILLNWYPNLSFEQTIQYTADWYKSFYESKQPNSVFDMTDSQIRHYVETAKDKRIKWACK